ncbi:hypothetical protein TrLO_g9165, partial [Triparma laevis f. longispina]
TPPPKKLAPPPKPKVIASGKFVKKKSKYGAATLSNPSSNNSKPNLAFNPNAKRIKELKTRMALSTTTFTALSFPTTSSYAIYQSKLKNSSTSTITESTTQFNEGSRGVETQTEQTTTKDAGCLVRGGVDDTEFEDMLSCIRSNKPLSSSSSNTNAANITNINLTGLKKFLTTSQYIMESLLEENIAREEIRTKSSGDILKNFQRRGCFKNHDKFTLESNPNGACVGIDTSSKSNTLIYALYNQEDGNSVSSVIYEYESYKLDGPVRRFECCNELTSFRVLERWIIAGDSSGSVVLFDLNEPYSVVKKAWASEGYSLYDTQHSSRILNVGGEGGVGWSFDDRGYFIVWQIMETPENSNESNPTAETGTLVKVVKSRVCRINRKRSTIDDVQTGFNETNFKAEGPSFEYVKSDPDGNNFVVGYAAGGAGGFNMFGNDVRELKSEFMTGEVDCVSFNRFVNVFIIAYKDGSVELYRKDDPTVVMRWESENWPAADHRRPRLDSDPAPKPVQTTAKVQVMWSWHRASVFYVLKDGLLFYIDLMVNDMSPGVAEGQTVDASFLATTKGSKNVGKVMFVVAGDDSINLRCVAEELVEEVKTLSDEEEVEWMTSWCEGAVYG